jgi:hypothetical protein
VVIVVGGDTSEEAVHKRAKTFGIPVVSIATERDLNIWTRQTREGRRA